MALTDVKIRQAIASIITSSLNTLYTGQDIEIRIYDHWMLGFNLGENAALLRSTEGDNLGKIHSWMVGSHGLSRVRHDITESPLQAGNRGILKKVGPNRRDLVRNYKIWCFHQLDPGEDGNESNNNSENRLMSEIEYVSDAFSNNPTLGLSADDAQWLHGHTELQFKLIDTFSFGEAKANVAQGVLSVLTYKPIF